MADDNRAALLAHLDAVADGAASAFGPDSSKPYPEKVEQLNAHLETCRQVVNDLHDTVPWVKPPETAADATEQIADLQAKLAEAQAQLVAQSAAPTSDGI